jgi:hypothetical protein
MLPHLQTVRISSCSSGGEKERSPPSSLLTLQAFRSGSQVVFINLKNVFGIPNNFITPYNVSLRTLSQAVYVYVWDTGDHILSINFSTPSSNTNNDGVHPY